jgi:hypothetical protein
MMGMGSGGAWDSMSGGGWGSFSSTKSNSTNDAHRFGLLLTQLYADRHSKSLPASVINILGSQILPRIVCFIH